MKMLTGFVLGLLFVFLLGAIHVADRVEIWGNFEKVGVYKPALSGITPDGNCYLAITNSITGGTDIFKIAKQTGEKMDYLAPLGTTSRKGIFVEPSK